MPRLGSQSSASRSLDLFFPEYVSATPCRSLHRELSDASGSGPRLLSLLPSDALTASPISHRALQGPTPGLGNTATDVAPTLEGASGSASGLITSGRGTGAEDTEMKWNVNKGRAGHQPADWPAAGLVPRWGCYPEPELRLGTGSGKLSAVWDAAKSGCEIQDGEGSQDRRRWAKGTPGPDTE